MVAATERVVVLMSPLEKRALDAKAARAGRISAGELVRRAVAAYDEEAVSEAAELRELLGDERLEPSTSLTALRALLVELEGLDRDGRWGHAFALRDRLRLGIATGASSGGMESRDWALWWTLIEELNRVEAAEGVLS